MSDRRGALAALALASLVALGAAGCAEEGRTIDTPLHVRGWAVDQSLQTGDSVTTVRFKIGVETASPCEAQHVLFELQLVDPVRHIRPVARYLSDDKCMQLPVVSADTVGTLLVNSLLTMQHTQVGGLDSLIDKSYSFAVDSQFGPTTSVVIDSSRVAALNTIRFEVHAIDDTTGAVVPGASVQVDDLTSGSPVSLGSGTTDANGLFVLNAAVTGATGVEVLPYRVTVTNGLDVTTFTVRTQKARGGSRERVFILL